MKIFLKGGLNETKKNKYFVRFYNDNRNRRLLVDLGRYSVFKNTLRGGLRLSFSLFARVTYSLMKGEEGMWVISWYGGIESYSTAEEARFVYWLLRLNGYEANIVYRRTYL